MEPISKPPLVKVGGKLVRKYKEHYQIQDHDPAVWYQAMVHFIAEGLKTSKLRKVTFEKETPGESRAITLHWRFRKSYYRKLKRGGPKRKKHENTADNIA